MPLAATSPALRACVQLCRVLLLSRVSARAAMLFRGKTLPSMISFDNLYCSGVCSWSQGGYGYLTCTGKGRQLGLPA